MSRERGSSRIWRRLANDALEHPLPSVTDNRRQTRIETLDFRHGGHSKGSRYDPGGESRLMYACCKHETHPYNAARTYSTGGRQML